MEVFKLKINVGGKIIAQAFREHLLSYYFYNFVFHLIRWFFNDRNFKWLRFPHQNNKSDLRFVSDKAENLPTKN